MDSSKVDDLVRDYFMVQAQDIIDRTKAASRKHQLISDMRTCGLSAKEIGDLLGISRQRVYQILKSDKVDV